MSDSIYMYELFSIVLTTMYVKRSVSQSTKDILSSKPLK